MITNTDKEFKHFYIKDITDDTRPENDRVFFIHDISMAYCKH